MTTSPTKRALTAAVRGLEQERRNCAGCSGRGTVVVSVWNLHRVANADAWPHLMTVPHVERHPRAITIQRTDCPRCFRLRKTIQFCRRFM